MVHRQYLAEGSLGRTKVPTAIQNCHHDCFMKQDAKYVLAFRYPGRQLARLLHI